MKTLELIIMLLTYSTLLSTGVYIMKKGIKSILKK